MSKSNGQLTPACSLQSQAVSARRGNSSLRNASSLEKCQRQRKHCAGLGANTTCLRQSPWLQLLKWSQSSICLLTAHYISTWSTSCCTPCWAAETQRTSAAPKLLLRHRCPREQWPPAHLNDLLSDLPSLVDIQGDLGVPHERVESPPLAEATRERNNLP